VNAEGLLLFGEAKGGIFACPFFHIFLSLESPLQSTVFKHYSILNIKTEWSLSFRDFFDIRTLPIYLSKN